MIDFRSSEHHYLTHKQNSPHLDLMESIRKVNTKYHRYIWHGQVISPSYLILSGRHSIHLPINSKFHFYWQSPFLFFAYLTIWCQRFDENVTFTQAYLFQQNTYFWSSYLTAIHNRLYWDKNTLIIIDISALRLWVDFTSLCFEGRHYTASSRWRREIWCLSQMSQGRFPYITMWATCQGNIVPPTWSVDAQSIQRQAYKRWRDVSTAWIL